MYRAGLEWLLGFRVRGAMLHLDPCIPRAWPRFEISFRYRTARYEITVENPAGVTRGVSAVEVNGILLAPGTTSVALLDDGATRRVRVVLGQPTSPRDHSRIALTAPAIQPSPPSSL